jgi:protein-tyrosine phosphatase
MKDYEDLINRGVFLQINWLSIIGYYSPQIKKKTEELISKEMVSFIGSDCHNMNHAKLYSKCQSKRSWHQLLESGKLLNHKL